MKLLYEGIDIAGKISINRCIHETYAEGMSDQLTLRFNDAAGVWNFWKPVRGEKVRLVDGSDDTGIMYITSIVPENGLFTLRAMAMPLSGETVNSRSWDNVKLLQLGADIAAKHGLTLKTYNVTDQVYSYMKQERLTDFEFLHRRCQLEGCAMLIFDNCLVIYDENKMESQPATDTIKVGADGFFTYSDDTAQSYGSAEVVSGNFKGSFTDSKGNASRVLRPRDPIDCTSSAEAIRYAKGLLRQANKNTQTGTFRRRLSRSYAAASVVNIKTEKASNWNGKIFITRTRHDFVTGETKIFFRKPLEGY